MTKQRSKASLLGLALFLIATTLAAQVTEEWVARYDAASYNDKACAIAIDGSGNVYVTGRSACSETGWDYATVKYNTSGVEQWAARYDGPESGGDYAYAIAIDGAGNVYVTGLCSWPNGDYATVKYNSSGVQQWVAWYDGSASDYDEVRAIAVDDAGNVYVTGRSVGSETYWDYATIKYNPSGTEQWVACYDAASDYDKAYAIAVDGAGNVYVTGSSGGYDYATIKYNSSGQEQWVARYNGPGNGWDWATTIAVDGSGNVYVTGTSDGSGISWRDYATIKYSQGPGVAEASPDVPGHRLEVAQLTPEPVITYTLPADTRISLKLFDVTGKLVRTLVSGSQSAGTHTACWDARNDSNQQVSAGLYFIRISTPGFSRFAKVVMLR